MTYGAAMKAYKATQIQTSDDPNQLVLMLYDGAVRFLEQAREGIDSGDKRKRGENLGRAIAVIGELNASLNMDSGELSSFLRGLYMNMMVELPKVNIGGSADAVDQSIRYLKELRRLWIQQVMKKKTMPAAADAIPDFEPSRQSHSVAV